MVSLKDILALLDKIPIWKQLKTLPERVESLERRIQELEQPDAMSERCPKCNQRTYELIETQPDPTFGAMGAQKRIYKCSQCGFSEARIVDP